jgi:hypothetical protein
MKWVLKSRAENRASHDHYRLTRRPALKAFRDDPTRRRFLTDAMLYLFSLLFSYSRYPSPLTLMLKSTAKYNNRDPGRVDNINEDAHRNTPPATEHTRTHTHTHTTHRRGEHTSQNTSLHTPFIQTRPYQLHPVHPSQTNQPTPTDIIPSYLSEKAVHKCETWAGTFPHPSSSTAPPKGACPTVKRWRASPFVPLTPPTWTSCVP